MQVFFWEKYFFKSETMMIEKKIFINIFLNIIHYLEKNKKEK